jgi:hypothetical protein
MIPVLQLLLVSQELLSVARTMCAAAARAQKCVLCKHEAVALWWQQSRGWVQRTRAPPPLARSSAPPQSMLLVCSIHRPKQNVPIELDLQSGTRSLKNATRSRKSTNCTWPHSKVNSSANTLTMMRMRAIFSIGRQNPTSGKPLMDSLLETRTHSGPLKPNKKPAPSMDW